MTAANRPPKAGSDEKAEKPGHEAEITFEPLVTVQILCPSCNARISNSPSPAIPNVPLLRVCEIGVKAIDNNPRRASPQTHDSKIALLERLPPRPGLAELARFGQQGSVTKYPEPGDEL